MEKTSTANRVNSKTLLVTGAAGFIGSNFVRQALVEGFRVVGLDSLTYAGHIESLQGLSGDFTFIREDIRSGKIKEILEEARPSALINFAAESHVDRSIENPLLFVDTNVLGTANLLKHCQDYWKGLGMPEGFRYLQISTDEVYGSLGDEGKFSEHTAVNPSSPYSASKTGGDHLVNAWHHTFKLPTVITRCFNNYGPYQFPEKLIPHMIDCALSGKPLPVYGEGKNIRDWIHVSDHCKGILLALQKGKPGSLFCLGGRSEVRNLDLVKTICAELDKALPRKDGLSYACQIAFVKDRLGHDYRYAIDDTLAQKELGFTREFNLVEGIKHTVGWYLNNLQWMSQVKSKIKES